ncbi:MAG: hypothetical protein ACI4RG_03200 [Huintestinicola sp.]
MRKRINLEKIFIVVFFLLTGVGLLISLISAVLFYKGNDFAGGVGVVSTIWSIILSAISLAYTYISGLQTLKTINDIKRQNDALVEEITHERSKDNYDDTNSELAFK